MTIILTNLHVGMYIYLAALKEAARRYSILKMSELKSYILSGESEEKSRYSLIPLSQRLLLIILWSILLG